MRQRRKQRRRFRRLVLGALVLLILGLGGRELYQRGYSHRTMVITETEAYRKGIPYRGVVLYDQAVYQGNQVALHAWAEGHRVGAHRVVGTAESLILDIDGDSPYEKIAKWMRERRQPERADQTVSPVPLLREKPETVQENQDAQSVLLPPESLRLEKGELILQRAGFVTSYNDGYEKRFAYPTRKTLRTEELQQRMDLPAPSSKEDAVVLINDHEYAVALLTENDPDHAKDETGRFTVDTREYEGTIIHSHQNGEQRLLVLAMNAGFHEIYPERFIEGERILQEFEAIKVPIGAWIDEEERQGLLIRNDDALVEFVPVSDAEITDAYVYIDKERTVLRVYDEIFLHPNSVKEGEFIE